MGYLFLLIVAVTLWLILLPILFNLVFTKVLGFSEAKIKLKHAFKFMGILLELKNPVWGI